MSDYNPTIIAASLSDADLKSSIDKLVQHVQEGATKMSTSMDAAVERMKRKLQELGNVNVSLGVSGTSSRVTKEQQQEAQATKEQTTALKEQKATLDQVAQAKQKAIGSSPAQDSYQEFVKNMRQNVALLAMEIKDMPNWSLDRQFGNYMQYEQQIEQVRQRIQELKQELQNVGSEPNSSRLVIKQITEQIAQEQQKLVQLQKEQITTTKQIELADKQALAQKQAQYETEKKALVDMSVGQRESNSFSERQVAQETKITDEIRKQAQAIREMKSYQTEGRVLMDNGNVFYDPERSLMSKKNILSLEEQIAQALQRQQEEERKVAQAAIETVQAKTQQRRVATGSYTEGFGSVNEMQARSNQLRRQTIEYQELDTSITRMNKSLARMTNQYREMNEVQRGSEKGMRLADEIQRVQRELQKAQAQMSRPVNLESALGIRPKTLDDMAYKMQRLQAYKQSIDLTKPTAANEIKQVDNALRQLQRDMDKYHANGKRINELNGALGRSWNYMKNRLAFYFTVGMGAQLVRQLINVRSQYEMNERALGILIGSAERGSQIFQELSQMALISPYTLIELSNATRQLTAYGVAAKDVVDTTRRLADMAAAVGIPMERLTYALGQIKAYGYLNSRDARMFANAGIPLVKQLADYYTELEGRLVSVGDVYDRIKKKAIDYNDVMQVINKMTDEGGKFFGFQEKMAETLKVQLANLNLAWNNVLNDFGASNQWMLGGTIKLLRNMLLHWKEINHAIRSGLLAGGLIIAVRALNVALVKLGLQWRILSKEMQGTAIMGTRLTGVFSGLFGGLKKLMTTPMTWWTLLAFAIVDVTRAIIDQDKAQHELNKSISEGAKDNYKNITDFLNEYKEVRDKLYKTETKQDAKGNVISITTTQDISENEANKAWEAMREQIELTTRNANEYIGSLLQIENVSERLRQGFKMLDDISVVNAALKEMDENTIEITNNWSKWWNLGLAFDGLIENVQDYTESLKKLHEAQNPQDIEEWTKIAERDLEQLQKDVKVTTDSIINLINLKGWQGDVTKINETFASVLNKITLDNGLTPEEAFNLQLVAEEARAKAAKQALTIRLKDEQAAYMAATDEETRNEVKARFDALAQEYYNFEKFNGQSRVYWNDFTKWMKEQHISEMTAMFKDMDAKQIASLDFTKGKYFKWVDELAKKYAKEHGKSYQEVFDQLRNFVTNANQWSINIPVFLRTIQPLSDVQRDYEARTGKKFKDNPLIKDAKSQVEIIDILKKKQKEFVDEMETARKAGGKYWEDNKQRYKEENDALVADIHAYNALTDAEEKANKKSGKGGSKKDPLLDALKQEISLVEKLQSDYDKLSKSDASQADALDTIRGAYGKTIRLLNTQLQSYGLPQIDISQLITGKDPNKALAHFKQTLDTLVSKGMLTLERSKELEAVVEKFTLSAKTYNLDMITKGLNNNLSKIKDEYELAVELDANPEMGNMMAQLFDIDVASLPHGIAEYARRVTELLNEYIQKNGGDFQLMNLDKMSRDDLEVYRKMVGNELGEVTFKLIEKFYNDVFKLREKNAKDVQSTMDANVKEYGELAAKLLQIEIDKNVALTKLDEAYNTEALRKTQEYEDARQAIITGAVRKAAKARFEDLRRSADYDRYFNAIETLTRKDALIIKNKIKGGIVDAFKDGGLTVTEFRKEIKNLESQFDILTKSTSNFVAYMNEGFDGLINRAKLTGQEIEAIGETMKATGKIDEKDKNFLSSLGNIFSDGKGGTNMNFTQLMNQFGDNIEGLGGAVSQAGMDMQEGAGDMAETIKIIDMIIQMAHQTVEAIKSVIDELNEARSEENKIGNAYLEGFWKSEQHAYQGWENLKNGNFMGAGAETINSWIAIFNAVPNRKSERVNKQIKQSERAVKSLEIAYLDLEDAVNHAMGAAEIGAKRAAIENKKLQLQEIERQLELEKSRWGKQRDNDKILQYEQQAAQLRLEIDNDVEEITNTLLGSSVKDAAEQFVDTWVEAWKAGETTLDAIEEKMDEIIENLIKKSLSSAIVGNLLQPLYDMVDDATKDNELTIDEITQIAQLAGVLSEDINTALGALYGQLESAGAISKEGITLSSLQQGIQSITEEQASALEAYLNSVSQQVYLQSDVLVEIRDILRGVNFDVNTGVQSQILLELQTGFQTVAAMRAIMEGWSTPSGMAVRVELQS